jgi:bacterioferritin (cytochrome b1)
MSKWMNTSGMVVALCAVLSTAASASAQPPKGTPSAHKAAARPGHKASADDDDKSGGDAGKVAKKSAGDADSGDTQADAGDGREAAAPGEGEHVRSKHARRAAKKVASKPRSKEEKPALRARANTAPKGQPMSEALKEEVKRHARRLARLERAKDVAEEKEDDAAIERVNKLVGKENARHDRWLTRHDAKVADKAGENKAGKN